MIAISIMLVWSIWWIGWILLDRANTGRIDGGIVGFGVFMGFLVALPTFLLLPAFGPSEVVSSKELDMSMNSVVMDADYPTDLDYAIIVLDSENGPKFIDYDDTRVRDIDAPVEEKTCKTHYWWLSPYGWNDCDRDIYMPKIDIEVIIN